MKSLNTSISCLVVAIAVICGMCDKTHATGSISGTVTDTSSNPVSDANVMVFLDGSYVDLEFTTSYGTYSITGLDPDTYEVHVEVDGYERRIEENVVVTNNNNTVKDITNLAVEGIITGKVTKSDGTTPVADAIVIADNGSGFEVCVITDDNGEYSIEKLPAGTYTVTVDEANYRFSECENIEVTPGETEENVDSSGFCGVITGIVTKSDLETPIQGIAVHATDSSDMVIDVDVTNSSGRYVLGGFATRTYTVEAFRPEGPLTKVSGVSVTDGQTTNRDLAAPGGSISGTVKNSSQAAIEGATLIATKEDRVYIATSDASGNYKIEFLPAGTYQVIVDPEENDYVAGKLDDVIVVGSQEKSNQNFTLSQDGKITGTITDSSQEPIEGAIVSAIEPDDAENDPTVAFIPTKTDADGNYTVRHLRSGTYTILVRAEGYVSDSETDVSVTAGQTTSGKNFSLGTSGGTISGTVYESDGQTEIEKAMVQCGSEGKSWGYTMSDSNGDYSLTLLQAGTYEVMAFAEGYEVETLNNIVLTGTEENSGNDFTLDEEE